MAPPKPGGQWLKLSLQGASRSLRMRSSVRASLTTLQKLALWDRGGEQIMLGLGDGMARGDPKPTIAGH